MFEIKLRYTICAIYYMNFENQS